MLKTAIIQILVILLLFSPTVILAKTDSATSSTATKNEAAKKRLEDTKLKSQERIKLEREKATAKIETRQEMIASKEATLKARLEKFKDKQKAKITQRVNTNLNKVNENKTSAMLRHLDKMSEILNKVKTRVTEAGNIGSDLASINTAITKAESTITTAKEAVETQSTKDYTIVATSEGKIKGDAKKARDSLHTDLKLVHDLVVAARKAVSDAISTAVSTLGGETHGK